MSFESEFVSWLRSHLPSSPRLKLGVGDDAAVLSEFTSGEVVLTTDTVTDGVDFILSEIDPRQAGHKALGVNLSDLAAMAAHPVAVVVSLVLPKRTAFELSVELYRGMLPLAEKFDTVIAGGDLNTWDGPLAVSITAVGEPTEHGVLTRSGAEPGDFLLVTGQLGGSILGRHLAIEPRIAEALLLNERYDLHAGIDISDGLALDASRMATESGVGIVLDLDTLPISDAAIQLVKQDGRPAIEHALTDGEDFELTLAVSPREAEQLLADQPLDVPLTKIGEVVSEPGLWKKANNGGKLPLAADGFQHEGNP